MDTSKDKHPSKSSFSDTSDNFEGAEKQIKGSGSSLPQNGVNKIQLNYNADTICSDTWISFRAVGASASQQSNLGEYEQLSLWKSTPTHSQYCDRTSQEYQFTQISETISPEKENSICLQWNFPVLAHQTQELEQDYLIQLPLFGEKDLDVLSPLNPASVLLNNLKEFSDEDLELFLADSTWQDTLGKLKQSRRESLGRVIKGSDYLSFPTLTSNVSTTSRPAGQTKCEKWFKDNGLIPSGSQLGTQAIALTMGFPSSWFEGLTEQYSKNLTTQSQVKPQAESEQDIWQDEQLHQDKQPLSFAESSISTQLLGGDKKLLEHKRGERSSQAQELSIPCLVKQPKQAEVKGIIKEDKGDCPKGSGFANRFLVDVDDGKEISVSKLFIYPDFSESVGQIPPTKSATPPSKNSPTKQRRKKGDGTGYIYRRTITRRGKQYQESYFRYRDESGKLKAKYIPQKLLDKVQEAESAKKPIADILFLLGGDGISRGEQFGTSDNTSDNRCVQSQDKSDELISVSRGEQTIPPSNKKRKQGEGTGYIECKPIKRGGNEYKQYWYHYEEWRDGDRTSKKSKYIPKTKRSQIEKMNDEKVPVEEILRVLSQRSKK